eukprot:CAMPEP_0205942572 /NCGR_PEP_ID=MMETSP1325-20131115/57963_1 /ASSEMBLY_ACC=CAM_ASM_000708 /TAXON_ID=236786 /ORGANISM="Florenciella sp., Strain RCC1007" /LENGTH=223 /DNA_ID=CAMNT_0053313303 /DNA_START=83 /DNA_END=751 /DNA_ORIENTATION=-
MNDWALLRGEERTYTRSFVVRPCVPEWIVLRAVWASWCTYVTERQRERMHSHLAELNYERRLQSKVLSSWCKACPGLGVNRRASIPTSRWLPSRSPLANKRQGGVDIDLTVDPLGPFTDRGYHTGHTLWAANAMASVRKSVEAEGGYMDTDAVRLREEHRRWKELMVFRKQRSAFDEHVEHGRRLYGGPGSSAGPFAKVAMGPTSTPGTGARVRRAGGSSMPN